MRVIWFVARAVGLHLKAKAQCWWCGHDDVHCADVGQRRRWVHCLCCGRNSLGIRTPEPSPRPHVMQDQHTPSRRRRLAKLQQRYQVR